MPKDIAAETTVTFHASTPVQLPSGDFVSNAQFAREGADLTLTSPDGHSIRIEGYFNTTVHPDIATADGAHFSPQMVEAFLPPQHPNQLAAAAEAPANDSTPVGKITEVTGHATIIHQGGATEAIKLGAAVHQGDVIQTADKGAVNILFSDNTTFAISQNARLSVDQFTYNAHEHTGSSFFSMLQGVFVYTSGLIGKEDPGQVGINTPVGSIGIRGTVVAGDIHPAGQDSHITILDGAIVVTNAGGTLEMNASFDTATLSGYHLAPTDSGHMDSSAFTNTYGGLQSVTGHTFDNITKGIFHTPETPVAPQAPVQMPDATPGGPLNTGLALHTTGTTLVTADAPATTFETTTTTFTTTDTTVAPIITTTTGSTGTGGTSTGTHSGGGTAGGSGGGTAPPPPAVGFLFSPHYHYGIGGNGDDGVNFSWNAGDIVGHINLANFGSVVPNITITGFNGSGDFSALGLTYNTISTPLYDTSAAPMPVLHFDSATGNITVLEPFAFVSTVNGNFNFTISAIDPGTNAVLATDSIVVQLNTPVPAGGVNFNIGDYTGASAIYPGTSANDTITSTSVTGNTEFIFGRGGNDTLIAEPGRPDALFGGAGNDIIVAPDKSFFFIDGGTGLDGVRLGANSLATQTFNFEGSNNVQNIEALRMTVSSTATVGQTIQLTLKDVFQMTDSTHTLEIGNVGTGYGSTVIIDNASSAIDFGAGVVNTTVPTDQTTTFTGTFNSQTVTLVIHQGNAAANDGVAITVT